MFEGTELAGEEAAEVALEVAGESALEVAAEATLSEAIIGSAAAVGGSVGYAALLDQYMSASRGKAAPGSASSAGTSSR